MAALDGHLVFIRGGCGDHTKLIGLQECIPELMEELRARAVTAGNQWNADIAVSIGALTGASCYESGQLSKSLCECRIIFGGEAAGKTSSKFQPVDCQLLDAGQKNQNVLMDAFDHHLRGYQGKPVVYTEKAFHAVCNNNDHKKRHRIDFHSDKMPGSYVPHDPITSMSWGCTGVLVIRVSGKQRDAENTHIIVAMHGDIVIMAGRFQERFEHSVPPVGDWADLLEKHRGQLAQWEIEAMQVEIDAIQNGLACPLFRHSITLGWLNSHNNVCLWSAD
jgi:hypothetical protein